ncbi:uncharacterized protein LOC111086416 [Limulus polyphemus]|uniref:Uncharacterized protein LOC111086416 n=1 Tax=Limulus polyphemus TaxID=6850 RepID=A0ABM1SML0_LIMPO|nr:uncharacterized protein LOC111086416 [Limulus polyphemus]XP_022244866.1 uncharacterized protein LOC111086416 [Limulus polyphemus]
MTRLHKEGIMLSSIDQKDDQPKWVEELLKRKRTFYRPVISDPAIEKRYVVTTTEPWKSSHPQAKADFHSTRKQSAGGRSFQPPVSQPLLSSTTSRPYIGPSGQTRTSAGETSLSVAIKLSEPSVRNVKQMHVENRSNVMKVPNTARINSDSCIRENYIKGHKEICKSKKLSDRDNSHDRSHVLSPPSSTVSLTSSSHFMEKDEKELEWGPGIVNKLKSKFVGEIEYNSAQENAGNRKLMAGVETTENLRQSIQVTTNTTTSEEAYFADNKSEKNSFKPDNFRISRSRDNMLSESAKLLQHSHKFKQTNHRRPPPVKNLSSSLRDQVSSSVLINESVVIVEHSAKTRRSGQCSPSASIQEENRNKSTFNLNDDDFRKRDTVSTYKRIFELPNNNINSHQQMKLKRPPMVNSRLENITSRRPVTLIVTPPTHSQKELLDKSVTKRTNDRYNQKSGLFKLETYKNDVKVSFKPQNTFKRSPSVTCDEGETKTSETKENSKDISPGHCRASRELENGVRFISSEALERIRSQGSTMVFGGKSAPLVKPRSKHVPSQRSVTRTKKTKAPPVPKRELSSNLQIPVCSSITKNTDIALVATVSPSPKYQPKEPLKPRENQPPAVDPILRYENKHKPVIHKTSEAEKFPEAVKEYCSTLYSTKTPDVSRNQQEEKFVGEEGDVEEVLRPSTLLGNKASLWKNPPPNNTIVFDFRGKNVQANLALKPQFCGKSSDPVFQKKALTGSDLYNGIVFDGNFGESQDYEDEESSYREVDVRQNFPPVSGLAFIGENTKVGKSAFLTTRNKKLRIQFDEEPTTFVYPAGTSHIQNDLEGSPDSNLLNRDATTQISTEISGVTDTFSSYTPSMLSTGNKFQLGLSRPIHRRPPSLHSNGPTSPLKNVPKPAETDESTSWSTSSSDLLF